jgi:hypothetical protein
MWGLSAIVTALGIIGDATGKWKNWPFLTNLSSSLAGALFGVPLAIVFFQRIYHSEEESQESRQMLRLAQKSSEDLLRNIAHLFPDWPSLGEFPKAHRLIEAAAHAIDMREGPTAYYSFNNPARIELTDSLEQGLREFLECCDIWREGLTLATEVVNARLDDVYSRLDYLEKYVNPRLVYAGFPDGIHSDIKKLWAAYIPIRNYDNRPTPTGIDDARRQAEGLLSNGRNEVGFSPEEWDASPVVIETRHSLGYLGYLGSLLKAAAMLCRSIDVKTEVALSSYKILDEFLFQWEPTSTEVRRWLGLE